MLDVKEIEFEYPDKHVLRDISFTLKPGCLLHLQGSNGSGKTTLLKVLAGILQPSFGDISLSGCSVTTDKTTYQKEVCFVGHKTGVNQLLTPREHYRFDLLDTGSFSTLTQTFSLKGLEDTPCGLLSVGQRRRVSLLRLLVSKASLWLLDEPLVALDQSTIARVMDVVNMHLDRGGMVILTSHQDVPSKPKRFQEYRL